MYSTITDIAHRLYLYRKKLNKKQEEMCKIFNVTQGYYNKLENGQHLLSFHCLQALYKEGGDVYYLLTGQEYHPGILDTYISKFQDAKEIAQFLKLLIWTTEQGMDRLHLENREELHSMWKYVSLAENEYITKSIWINIRKAEELSQLEMAELMDINIKRYRRIEKMDSLPDAVILATLYEKLSYSPLLFLENKLYFPDIINRIWKTFPEALTQELISFLDDGVHLISEKSIKSIDNF